MVADNFNLVYDILSDIIMTSEEEYKTSFIYHVMILTRKKDGNVRDGAVIKNFYFSKAYDLLDKKDTIIRYCRDNNARAYINLNLRDNKSVAITALHEIAAMLTRDNFNNMRTIYESSYGATSAKGHKTWVIDCDDKSNKEILDMVQYIDTKIEPTSSKKVRGIIPTVNGFHILSNPFNPTSFTKTFGMNADDIKKDNPTLLYFESPKQ